MGNRQVKEVKQVKIINTLDGYCIETKLSNRIVLSFVDSVTQTGENRTLSSIVFIEFISQDGYEYVKTFIPYHIFKSGEYNIASDTYHSECPTHYFRFKTSEPSSSYSCHSKFKKLANANELIEILLMIREKYDGRSCVQKQIL